ncbi:NACHT, LRR and PYD domains-containing protein 3-like [Engystomops pustulosus]|uniref:NACHT, LRR and PYD domains-containing protein 3-like n=1 Tax=Engystomops pustulosus TaxID=76066 RepID=UPI003AFA301D
MLGELEQRWMARLSKFNFKTQYRPGRENANADALSRNPVERPTDEDREGDETPDFSQPMLPHRSVAVQDIEAEVWTGGSEEDWRNRQQSDHQIRKVRDWLQMGHGPTPDDETRQFGQKICQYEDHILRMTYKYFQDDLLYIVENLRSFALLSQLESQKFPNVEKYKDLQKDMKLFAQTLVSDILKLRKEAMIGLWVSLYVVQREHPLPALHAVLEELCVEGRSLVEKILLDKTGHLLPPELEEVQNNHKEHLREKTEKLVENKPPGCNQQEERFPFCTRYVNLIIVSPQNFTKRSENELIKTGEKLEECLKEKRSNMQRIFPKKIFHWCHWSRFVPHIVMVVGVPGVGKTTLMQKIVFDWMKGDQYQRFSFVFFFKFRELNRLDKVSLETMILQQYPYLWQQLGNILQDPEKLLFIFDGLDESNHTMDFASGHLCSDPKQPEHCGKIVVSLVRKSLLNGCSVLMTSRPTRLAPNDYKVFQRILEIAGFFPDERKIYFENFFSDPELAEKAFTYVKQNETLYTFCYLPSYCWIICTVLSRSFQTTSSDQQVSLLPKTVTQLFAIYVANILSNHSLEKSGANELLQSIGWMAEHGVMNRNVIFDDRDLESFYVDNNSKLLSSFLMESEKPVTYSFIHLTVQEFFAALVHYNDYSHEKLQNSIDRAKSYPDGRGEIFLRFLCGLADATTRSILKGYLGIHADQASREVITWLKNLTDQKSVESKEEKKHLLGTYFYLFESRNKALVKEALKSHQKIDCSGVDISALDCTVLASIMDTCTNIEDLNLTECSVHTEGLERLAPALKNLQNLSLGGNYLPDSSCVQLASVLRNTPALKKLDLSYNHLSGPHFSDLMEALSSPSCSIEELNLGGNDLPATSCKHLASVITNNQSLKKLNLSYNCLSGPHLGALMEALSSPACRIEEICLASNNLQEDFCTQLGSVIVNNQSLKKIVLSDNHLSGPQLSDLMEALSSPACRIQELHLDSNNLSDTSCIQLASVIKNNHSLRTLNLSYNSLSGPHLSDLMEALSSPACSIEELQMEGSALTEEEKEALEKMEKQKPNLKISYKADEKPDVHHLSI